MITCLITGKPREFQTFAIPEIIINYVLIASLGGVISHVCVVSWGTGLICVVIRGYLGISTFAHWCFVWAVRKVNNLRNRADGGAAKRAGMARVALYCGMTHGVSDAQPPN